MKRPAILLGLAVTALSLLGASSAASAPLAGSLDPSFGSNGVAANSSGSHIEGIAVQPDGKIVVAVGSAVGRYLPNGSSDPSFGAGGFVQTHLSTSADAVALQPDGKIVVAGSYVIPDTQQVSEFAIARYNPDGSPDASFGSDGVTNTFIPVSGSPAMAGVRALAILPGGEILAGGSAGWENDAITPSSSLIALVLYKSDGSLDSTFGNGGIVQTSVEENSYLTGIFVRPDGKIVAAGGTYGFGHGDDTTTMAIVRYEPDGSLDPRFGSGGRVATRAGLKYEGGPATIQGGKIVLAGATNNYGFPVLARYTRDGRLDATFGAEGFVSLTSLQGGPAAVLAQADGKILIAVSSAIVRLLPNGRRDQSFGRGGTAALGSPASSLALQSDGKILTGGGNGTTWTLARLLGGDNCVVPRLRGTTIPKASVALSSAYCGRGRNLWLFSHKIPRGRVISTLPPQGSRLPGNSEVRLVVSRGKH